MPINNTARPIFNDFPNGRFRLNWVGGLWPSKQSGGYEIDVQLVPMEGFRRPPIARRVPLGALPLLVAGSEWEDGRFRGWGAHETADVEVNISRFDDEARAVSPYTLLGVTEYFLHRMPAPCYCRVFRAQKGFDLIVPTWEILRAWYLFHPRVVSAVVGGGLRFPESVSSTLLPWRPDGTDWPAGNMPQICRRKFISESVAMRLARLLFDPIAENRAYYIYRNLQSSRVGRADGSRIVPPVLPPYEGTGQWKIWYRTIPGTGATPTRRLVLRICGATAPLPYADLIVASEVDNSQGANQDDPNLPLSWARSPPENVLPEDGAVVVSGMGADGALNGIDIDHFAFDDNAVHAVNRHTPVKLLQSYRHGGGQGDPVKVGSVSMDPTAMGEPGQAAQGSGGTELTTDDSRLPSTVSFVAMQDVFAALVEALNGPASDLPVGWTASFYKEGGVCLSVYNDKRAERRLFLILRVTDGTRHVYVLEAQRLRQNESYSILICEERYGLELNDSLFFNWLSRFPYTGGTHWMSYNYDDLALIPMPAIHQPHREGQTDEMWFRCYIERMHEKVTSFVNGRHEKSRSIATFRASLARRLSIGEN